MHSNLLRVCPAVVIVGAMAAGIQAGTITEPVTYQGQLKQGGLVVNETCDFQFGLWTQAEKGELVGRALEVGEVDVVNGLFQVELNFSPESFDGSGRWLEISVRCPSSRDPDARFTTLTPRERVTSAPYALQTRGIFVSSANDVGIGTTAPLYDFHLRSAGNSIGGTNVATAGIHNSFLVGLEFVQRWFDFRVGGDVELSMHTTGNLSLVRRSSQDSTFPETEVFLDTSGNVGLGTSAPEESIHVVQTGAVRDAIVKLSVRDEGSPSAGVVMCQGLSGFEECASVMKDGSSLNILNDFGIVKLGSPSRTVVTVGFDSVNVGTGAQPADLTVSGNVGMRYVTVDSGWVAGSTQLLAVCPSGTKVLGGGCETAGNGDVVKRTYPGGDAGWVCVFEVEAANHRAHAICAGVE